MTDRLTDLAWFSLGRKLRCHFFLVAEYKRPGYLWEASKLVLLCKLPSPFCSAHSPARFVSSSQVSQLAWRNLYKVNTTKNHTCFAARLSHKQKVRPFPLFAICISSPRKRLLLFWGFQYTQNVTCGDIACARRLNPGLSTGLLHFASVTLETSPTRVIYCTSGKWDLHFCFLFYFGGGP